MEKLEKIIECIETNYKNKEEKIIKQMIEIEKFIKENGIELTSEDYIKLIDSSKTLKRKIKDIIERKIKIKNIFIKKLIMAYKVTNSYIDLEDKAILEALKINFDPTLRDILFNKYKSKVEKIIQNNYKNSKEILDHLQDGYEILLNCIDKYDLANNYSFSKYLEYQLNCKYIENEEKAQHVEITPSIEIDIEKETIIKDYIEKFNELLSGIELPKYQDTIYTLIMSNSEKKEYLREKKITPGIAGTINRNTLKSLLRTNILDEYVEYLDNPKLGKQVLQTLRETYLKKYADLRMMEKSKESELNTYQELISLGITEEEIAMALKSLSEYELKIIYYVSGEDLNHPRTKEELAPKELLDFYSAKRNLINRISKNRNKQKVREKKSERSLNIYETLMSKGYTEEEITSGINGLSEQDKLELNKMSNGNVRNSIILINVKYSDLKEIIKKIEKNIKRHRQFLLTQQAMNESQRIYNKALIVAQKEKIRKIFYDVDITILIIIFLKIGIIENQEYNMDQIKYITGLKRNEVKIILRENLEEIKNRLKKETQTLKLK